MSQKSIGLAVLTAIVFFVVGFAYANFLNRTELNGLRGENERLKASTGDANKASEELTLTDAEIAEKVAESERNATNFTFQKNLGLGLYRYGAIKKDKEIIRKSIPVLIRASSINSNDYDVTVALGHAYYDVGYFGKENGSFVRAREVYAKALEKRKDDVEVRTDLGMTYFLQEPPDLEAAVAEFERSLAINPEHEKTLAFAALAMKNQGKDFSKLLSKLRSVNPNNATLRELEGNGGSAVRQ